MPYVSLEDETPGSIERYYEDHAAGTPGVLFHQEQPSGGLGSQPTSGDDDDRFAAYLDVLLRV